MFMQIGLFFLSASSLCLLYIFGVLISGFFSIDKKSYRDSLKQAHGWELWNEVIISTIKYRHDLLLLYSILSFFLSIFMFFMGR